MSMFGDDDKGTSKNYLFDVLEDFFKEGRTWQDLFDILETFCELGDYRNINVCDERDLPTVSEEQVLFNKLDSENQKFILKQMRLLQPCELEDESKGDDEE